MTRLTSLALSSLLLLAIIFIFTGSRKQSSDLSYLPPNEIHGLSKKANMSLTIRPANESDIDRITEIAVAGFPTTLNGRIATLTYTNRTKAGANQMMLAESPLDEDHNKTEVIAFSIWDNPGSKTAVAPVTNHFDRPDADPERMHAFLNVTMKARQEVFVSRYGPNQMSLRQMVTHPHYWRRGAGHLLVDWGVKQATEKEVAIVMFSSPMGKALYETFGFRELSRLHIQVDGQEESLDDISCMAWEEGWTKVVRDDENKAQETL